MCNQLVITASQIICWKIIIMIIIIIIMKQNKGIQRLKQNSKSWPDNWFIMPSQP